MKLKILENRIGKEEQGTKIPHSPFPIPHSIRNGFGMVEMLIGAAVLSVSLLGISSFFQTALSASNITQSVFQGDYLLEEGVEAVKLLRDGGYASNIATLSTTTPTYLSWNGTKWATSSVNTLVDGKFGRAVIAEEVRRDGFDDISASGTVDANTKLITVSVAWSAKGATTTKTMQTYVMNIFNN